MNNLHQEIVLLLHKKATSYAWPMNSREIGDMLQVTPSYVRSQLSQLVKEGVIAVRRGNGGGYYIKREGVSHNAGER